MRTKRDAASLAASRRVRPPLLVTLGAMAAALCVAIPVTYIAVRATDNGWAPVWATLWRARTASLLARSVGLATFVTGISVVIGVAAAWLVTFSDIPGRGVWRVALAMPLALPSYVASWAWIGWQPGLAGFWGAALVLVTVSYPYVYLPVLGALRGADPALAEVGRAAGLGPWRAAITITLRQVRIATLGGSMLVMLYVLSEFGAVSIMRYESLTKVIYESYRASFDRTPAAVLGCVLVAVTSVPLVFAVRHGESDRAATVGGGQHRSTRIVTLGRWRTPVLACAIALLAASLGVPAVNLVRWVQQGSSQTEWSDLARATWTTLWLGVAAAAVTVIVAFPVGLLSARFPGRLSRHVTTVAYAGHSLPGIVVALSMVFFGVRYLTPIYQRAPMLIGAYVVMFLSLAIGAVHNAIALAPPVLDDVARSLGCSTRGVWLRVVGPLAAPGLGAAATLVFIATMKELPATLLLHPIGADTLATRLWAKTDAASYSAAAPYAVTLVVLAAVPTALLTRSSLRDRG